MLLFFIDLLAQLFQPTLADKKLSIAVLYVLTHDYIFQPDRDSLAKIFTHI